MEALIVGAIILALAVGIGEWRSQARRDRREARRRNPKEKA